jgi:hypothetical protein
LQLAMGICMSDFFTHGKKGSKSGRHLLIKSRKRALAVIRFGSNTGCSRSLSMIMLCMITHAFMVSHI